MRLQSRGHNTKRIMKLCKNKFLNILLNIMLLVMLPLTGGILFAMFFEYVFWLVLVIPGFVAFLAGGLNNGANMN